MTLNKKFEELSADEIRYVLSLNCVEIKDYLLKTHGEICFKGFIRRLVNCSIDNLTPMKIIKQNEGIKYYRRVDQNVCMSTEKWH